jgi:hypothetical protein
MQDRVNIGRLQGNVFPLFSCYFFGSDHELFTDRTVLNVIQIASTAGGFASIIIIAAKACALVYAIPLFHASLIKKMYKAQNEGRAEELKSTIKDS